MLRNRQVRRARLTGLLLVALVSCALGLITYGTDMLRSLDLTTVDTRFSIRGEQQRPDEVVVVAIDGETFSQLALQWPFPRHVHARVIERLDAAGAAAIAYDVQFTEPTVPKEDAALIEAVDRANGVVLSTTEVNSRGESNVFGGERVVRQVGARAASTVVQADPGGVLRRFPLSFDGLVGLPVAAVEAATGRPVDRGDAGSSEPWIDYRGGPGTIRSFPFYKVLRGQVPAAELRDKIVVVGATAPSLQDFYATPVGKEHEMPGVEVEANSIWTVEHGFPLKTAPGAVDVLLILLFGLAPPAAQLRLRSLLAFGGALSLGVLFAVGAQLAFDSGQIVSVVYPLGTLLVSAVGALVVTTLITAYERQWVRDTFARFVPEAVVDDVLARADQYDLRLAGVRVECTVMFTDLRGFTSMAETVEPEEVIDVLNHYLSEMSDAIMDHGGTLVAYMGDGIMALFGAPIEQPDHADRALAAAREMLDVRLERFNEWIRSAGLSEGFRMGIGLNTGLVMSGQVGSERRIEYTAVGDTTNTAARLEGMTKGTQHMLFVAESTRELLSDPDQLEFFDELAVRGRTTGIRIWTLPSDRVAS
jgi:adenylate cyclase